MGWDDNGNWHNDPWKGSATHPSFWEEEQRQKNRRKQGNGSGFGCGHLIFLIILVMFIIEKC